MIDLLGLLTLLVCLLLVIGRNPRDDYIYDKKHKWSHKISPIGEITVNTKWLADQPSFKLQCEAVRKVVEKV